MSLQHVNHNQQHELVKECPRTQDPAVSRRPGSKALGEEGHWSQIGGGCLVDPLLRGKNAIDRIQGEPLQPTKQVSNFNSQVDMFPRLQQGPLRKICFPLSRNNIANQENSIYNEENGRQLLHDFFEGSLLLL